MLDLINTSQSYIQGSNNRFGLCSLILLGCKIILLKLTTAQLVVSSFLSVVAVVWSKGPQNMQYKNTSYSTVDCHRYDTTQYPNKTTRNIPCWLVWANYWLFPYISIESCTSKEYCNDQRKKKPFKLRVKAVFFVSPPPILKKRISTGALRPIFLFWLYRGANNITLGKWCISTNIARSINVTANVATIAKWVGSWRDTPFTTPTISENCEGGLEINSHCMLNIQLWIRTPRTWLNIERLAPWIILVTSTIFSHIATNNAHQQQALHVGMYDTTPPPIEYLSPLLTKQRLIHLYLCCLFVLSTRRERSK